MPQGRQDPAALAAAATPLYDHSAAKIVGWRVTEPEHPLARSLLAYWEANRGSEGLPDRSKFPAPELKAHLPYLYLYEPVDPEGTDWRCRVSGTAIRERYGGADPKGSTLKGNCGPELAAQRAQNYREVCAAGRPFVSRGRLVNIGRDFYEAEVVNLPVLGARGARWLLGGMFFFDR